jgi:hypothetical protein
MKRKRYTEELIISILKEHEAGASVPDIARRHGVAEATVSSPVKATPTFTHPGVGFRHAPGFPQFCLAPSVCSRSLNR